MRVLLMCLTLVIGQFSVLSSSLFAEDQSGATVQEVSPEASDVALQLMKKMGADAQFEAIVPLMFESQMKVLKAARPDVSQKALDRFRDVFVEEFTGSMDELLVGVASVYTKHFSVEEMYEIIAFYDTSVGQKMIDRMPQMMQESMQVGGAIGAKVGMDVAQRAMEKVRKEGFDL